jgi:malonyl-CoA O-methyltransferase
VVNRVDKSRVGAAFSRGAAAYDEHARVQRAVVDRVLALAAAHAPEPRRALDVGSGTGSLLERLRARHPALRACGLDLADGMARATAARGVAAVRGDAEALPFAEGSFDLVLSSSTFQWMPSLDRAVAEAARVLAPGGALVAAFFGDGTLHELRDAWASALPPGAPMRLHRVHPRDDLARAIAAAGLAPVSLEVERHVEHHGSVMDLLRALRRIGAGNAAPERPRGLAEAHVVTRMIARYERLRGPDGLPASWDVVYGVARRRA